MNSNCIDLCVLEWCKLFADKKGEYGWRNLVSHPDQFYKDLLTHLGLDDGAFQKIIKEMAT